MDGKWTPGPWREVKTIMECGCNIVPEEAPMPSRRLIVSYCQMHASAPGQAERIAELEEWYAEQAARIAELEAENARQREALRWVSMWFEANAGQLPIHQITKQIVKQALASAEGEEA